MLRIDEYIHGYNISITLQKKYGFIIDNSGTCKSYLGMLLKNCGLPDYYYINYANYDILPLLLKEHENKNNILFYLDNPSIYLDKYINEIRNSDNYFIIIVKDFEYYMKLYNESSILKFIRNDNGFIIGE